MRQKLGDESGALPATAPNLLISSFFHSFEFLGSLLAHDAPLVRVVSVTVDAVAALKKGENVPEEVRAAGTFV
jgi:hypothetical protein